MARWSAIAGVLIPLTIIGASARAADSPEVEQLREQLRSTVLQLRQLQDQQAQAPAPPTATAAPAGGDAALKAKLSSLQAQLAAARRQAAAQAGSQAALAKAQSDNAALTAAAAAAASAAELEKFKGAYNQAQETNRTLTAERDRLKTQLTQATYVASVCKAKNDRLVDFARSLLTAYNRVSFGDEVVAREPFLQLKRVRLENLAQNREDMIWAATCDAGATAAPPSQPQAGAQPSSAPGF